MQMMQKLKNVSYSTWQLRLQYVGHTAMPEEKVVAADRQHMATHKLYSFQLLRPLLVGLCHQIHGKKGFMNMLLL